MHMMGVWDLMRSIPRLQDNEKRSALRTIRETELFGGVLSTFLSREYLALTADFLPGNE